MTMTRILFIIDLLSANNVNNKQERVTERTL